MRMICRMVHSPKNYDIWFLLLLLIISCHHIIFGYQIYNEIEISEAHSVALEKGNGLKSSPPLENLQSTFLIVEHYLLVASHDAIYNVSLSDLSVFAKISWPSNEFDKMLCQTAYDEKKCVNSIKIILEKQSSSPAKEFLVCGTNSYQPKCMDLVPDGEGYNLTNETDARAIAPGDPDFVSTSVYYGDRLFTAAEHSNDAIIYSSQIRTPRLDPEVLKEPVFVKSLIHQDIVYFFFREVAVDHNCDAPIFSRVARLCPNDKGGKEYLQGYWTSFFKARLTCSIQGKFPVNFDEIHAISEIGQGNAYASQKGAKKMIYALFSSPRHGLQGSAICGFKMSDIVNTFKLEFKEKFQKSWITSNVIPSPHPAGHCPEDSLSIRNSTLHFISQHPFMDKAVRQFGRNPIFTQSSFIHTPTCLVVDWQKQVNDTYLYDVIFIGTDTGRILKVFNLGTTPEVYPELVEVLIIPSSRPIIGLKIFIDPMVDQKKLLIITKDQIFSAPLHRCSLARNCRSCLSLKDPYCRWGDKGCADSEGLQNLKTGKSPECPDSGAIRSYFECNRIVLMLFMLLLK